MFCVLCCSNQKLVKSHDYFVTHNESEINCHFSAFSQFFSFKTNFAHFCAWLLRIAYYACRGFKNHIRRLDFEANRTYEWTRRAKRRKKKQWRSWKYYGWCEFIFLFSFFCSVKKAKIKAQDKMTFVYSRLMNARQCETILSLFFSLPLSHQRHGSTGHTKRNTGDAKA